MVKNKTVAALDVGSSKVAALIAQIDEEGKINVTGASAIPAKGIKRGQIINLEQATEAVIGALEAAERMAGFRIRELNVAIGGAHIVSQNSRGVVAVANSGGDISEEDVARVAEAAQAISLPASREIFHAIPRLYTVDSQEGIADPVGMSGVRLEVETHIITASSTAIGNLQKCVSEAGATINNLSFNALASAATVLTPTEKELGVILVDIGGGTTSVIIFHESSPIFSLVLPIGAQNITNDLAVGLRLSIEQAEKLKIKLSQKDKKEDEILKEFGLVGKNKKITVKTITEEIIRPRLEEIFSMISDEVKHNDFTDIAPAGVVLTGGGAQTVGAVELARSVMALPVRIGVPQGVTGLVDDILTPEFSALIGLILLAQEEGKEKHHFNFHQIGKKIPNLPLRDSWEKVIKMFKSFLP